MPLHGSRKSQQYPHRGCKRKNARFLSIDSFARSWKRIEVPLKLLFFFCLAKLFCRRKHLTPKDTHRIAPTPTKPIPVTSIFRWCFFGTRGNFTEFCAFCLFTLKVKVIERPKMVPLFAIVAVPPPRHCLGKFGRKTLCCTFSFAEANEKKKS